MSGQALKGGTAYEVTGGKTLVSSTEYDIAGGKTLIGGTEHDISFKKLISSNSYIWSGNIGARGEVVAYGNGYYVVAGRQVLSSTYYARIAYTTEPNGNWTTVNIWSNGSGSYANDSNCIKCITYANGYWIVGGDYYNGSTHTARIAYATSLSGTWTVVDLWGNSTAGCVNAVTYGNGYFVVTGTGYVSGTNYCYVAYATTPSGSWTTRQVTGNGLSNCGNSIAYANGYYVIGSSSYSDSDSNNYGTLIYTTSPSGTWSFQNRWSTTEDAGIYCITYQNGYWVAAGTYGDNARVSRATSPTGVWATKDLWSSTSSRAVSVAYGNGYWVVGGRYYDGSTYYGRIAYSTDLTGSWTTNDLWSGSGASHNYVTSVAYGNDFWLAGGRNYSSSRYYAKLAYDNSDVPFSSL